MFSVLAIIGMTSWATCDVIFPTEQLAYAHGSTSSTQRIIFDLVDSTGIRCCGVTNKQAEKQ